MSWSPAGAPHVGEPRQPRERVVEARGRDAQQEVAPPPRRPSRGPGGHDEAADLVGHAEDLVADVGDLVGGATSVSDAVCSCTRPRASLTGGGAATAADVPARRLVGRAAAARGRPSAAARGACGRAAPPPLIAAGAARGRPSRAVAARSPTITRRAARERRAGRGERASFGSANARRRRRGKPAEARLSSSRAKPGSISGRSSLSWAMMSSNSVSQCQALMASRSLVMARCSSVPALVGVVPRTSATSAVSSPAW